MAVGHYSETSLASSSPNITPIDSSSDCSGSLLLTSSSSSGSTLSLPSQSSTTSSSIDSSLQSFYTSCVFQNFPFRYLSSSPRGNSCVLSLAVVGDFVIAGTVADGMRVFRTQDLVPSYGFDSGTVAGGAVKALLAHQAGILSAHQDGKIRIWRRNNKLQAEDDGPAEDLQQRGGFKLSGSLPTTKDVLSNFLIPSNYVRVRRHRRQLWIRHADAVSCLAYSGDVIYSGSWDKTVKIWRASDMKCLESFVAHDDAVNALAVNGHFLYTAGADGKIKAWERTPQTSTSINKSKSKSSVTLVAVLERHKSSVNALAFDASRGRGFDTAFDAASGYLYSASSDKSILVWEREDTAMHMAVVDELKGHRRPVLCLAIARVGDSTLLCSGSADKTIRVWRREREIHSCLCVIRGHQGPVKSVAMRVGSSASSGALVYSGSLDCHVKAWWVSLDGSDEDEGLEKKLVQLKSTS